MSISTYVTLPLHPPETEIPAEHKAEIHSQETQKGSNEIRDFRLRETTM